MTLPLPAGTVNIPVDVSGKQVYASRVKVKIEEIIEWGGGTNQALAEKLGLESGQAISMWRGRIPDSQAYKIEVLSEGRFKVKDMPIKRKTKQLDVGGREIRNAPG